MKFYQTKQFIELHKKWSEKLKKSGFRDLEPGEGDKLPAQFYVAREIKRPERLLSALEYYTQASKFYWDYRFNTEREKLIWFYHSEGMPYREIAGLVYGENYSSIYEAIKKLKPVFLEYVKAQWDYENNEDD